MKRLKSRFSRKGKTVLAVSILGVAALVIGATIAYDTDRSVMNNKFSLFSYRTLFTETFDAPTNWITCQTIDKSITVKNEYDEPVAVRLKLEEKWIASDGVTELPLNSATSGLTMAQINFAQNSGWTKAGQYYYYDTDLAKNASTTSPITGVTLNCNANLNVNDPTADGAYSGATYHLKITAQTIEAAGKSTWDNTLAAMIAKKVNAPTNIDYRAVATESSGNGNGVNEFTENGQPIYYYRGEINDNNVIWGGLCWKIMRTTATEGVKIIYNGEPSDVVVDGQTVKQCLATNAAALISYNSQNYFAYNTAYSNSPADVGYMYGARISGVFHGPSSSYSFIFSNNVSKNGNTYTLDTDPGQSITGTWESVRATAATKYHYYCGNGAASCTGSNIRYIYQFNGSNIAALPLDGYEDIEDIKDAMFANDTDSNAKAIVESWFELKNLDNKENDLEDAVYCNDRSFAYGALVGKDRDVSGGGNDAYPVFASYARNQIAVDNNYHPSLECGLKRDAFTKDETATTNGELNHKVGLATLDEITLAGATGTQYLSGYDSWTMSPAYYYNGGPQHTYWWSSTIVAQQPNNTRGFRPVVTLKAGTEAASGTGLKTDPYIVE